jgi:hypothetical protein
MGFEPTQTYLGSRYSTTELRSQLSDKQHTGIEPMSSDWKSDVLPLALMLRNKSESDGIRTRNLLIDNQMPFQVGYASFSCLLVPPAGLEPATYRVKAGCSVQLSYGGR